MLGKRESPDDQGTVQTETNQARVTPPNYDNEKEASMSKEKSVQGVDSHEQTGNEADLTKVQNDSTNNEGEKISAPEANLQDVQSNPSEHKPAENSEDDHSSDDSEFRGSNHLMSGSCSESEEDEEVSSEHEDINDLDIEDFKKFCRENPLPPAKRR